MCTQRSQYESFNFRLKLVVDDITVVDGRIQGKKRITTTSRQFFGGVSNSIVLLADKMGTEIPFVGCIGDVTVNKKYVKFFIFFILTIFYNHKLL